MDEKNPESYQAGTLTSSLPDPNHIHLDWLRRTAGEMAEDYAKIFSKVSQSKSRTQESGHEIETAWATFLSNWLPPTYEVATRKYIIGEVDTETLFESDIVVFRPSYPKILREKTHILVSGVAAAFSVKSTIRPESIDEATRRCAQIQRTLATRSGSMRKELTRPFPYGLLAHSHDWKKPASQPAENISKELHKRDVENSRHPRESIDLICVPDLGVWNKSTSFSRPIYYSPSTFPNLPPDEVAEVLRELSRPRLTTAHIHTPSDDGGQAIAVFLTALYSYLAMGDPTLVELARSFAHMGGGTEGSGASREWAPNVVLTPDTLEHALSGKLDVSNGEHALHYGVVMPW